RFKLHANFTPNWTGRLSRAKPNLRRHRFRNCWAPTRLRRLAPHEARQFADVAAGMAHEKAGERADGIDGAHAEIARETHGCDVVGEEAVQAVGCPGKRDVVEAAPTFVTAKDSDVADVAAQSCRIKERFGEGRNI